MHRTPMTVALLGLAIASCGKSEAKLRQEIKDCSAITVDASGIGKCLQARFKWSPANATTAGISRQHELDSAATFQKDSLWQADAQTHRTQLASCAAEGGDVARCLQNDHGWDGEHAIASADSLWRRDGSTHRREVQNCARQRKSSVGSCLMLHYKWAPQRALALDDSLSRAKAKAWKRP